MHQCRNHIQIPRHHQISFLYRDRAKGRNMYRPLSFALILITMWLTAGSNHAADPTTAKKAPDQPHRPNILWILAEDLSPFMGCYDDPINKGHTPTIDGLAHTDNRPTRFRWGHLQKGLRLCTSVFGLPIRIDHRCNADYDGYPPTSLKSIHRWRSSSRGIEDPLARWNQDNPRINEGSGILHVQ